MTLHIHLLSKWEEWTNGPGSIESIIRSFAGAFRPESAIVDSLEFPFDPARVAAEVYRLRARDSVSVTLQSRAAAHFLTFTRGHTLGLAVWSRIHGEPDPGDVVAFVTAVAEAMRADYGFADRNIDSESEPLVNNPYGPLRVSHIYCLNVIGPGMSAPAIPGERRDLSYGGVLILHRDA